MENTILCYLPTIKRGLIDRQLDIDKDNEVMYVSTIALHEVHLWHTMKRPTKSTSKNWTKGIEPRSNSYKAEPQV